MSPRTRPAPQTDPSEISPHASARKARASYEDFRTFAEAIMRFFTTTLPQGWGIIRDTVNDNFHIIRPEKFRVVG